MRSIWKGAVSFGLVTIPVKLYAATEAKDVSFHQVHRTDGGRIRYQRVCTTDGKPVEYADIAKGFELPSGDTVVVTDEDFAGLPLATTHTIEVLQFVPLDQIDPIYYERSYYVEPDQAGVKAYVLLRKALAKSGKVAIVKIALRQRETLAALRIRDDVFVLETMLWPDEVREADFRFLDAEEPAVRPQELTMAGSLIETLSGNFSPQDYHDDYRAALQKMLDAKAEGGDIVSAPEHLPDQDKVVDLVTALRASIDAAKKRPSETRRKKATKTATARRSA